MTDATLTAFRVFTSDCHIVPILLLKSLLIGKKEFSKIWYKKSRNFLNEIPALRIVIKLLCILII